MSAETEALRLEIEALLRQYERDVAQAFQRGRAFERRLIEEARHRRATQPRQLGGGLALVVEGFDQRPPDDDFDQSPASAGEEAA